MNTTESNMTQTTPDGAYTIDQFCRAHGMSRGMFYLLRTRGQAPKLIRAGRRILISVEAARRWRERMERTG